MDRQRNDRLGRTGRFRQQSKHRRQILRPIRRAKSNPNCDRNSHCDADGHIHGYSRADVNANRYGTCNSYTNIDGETFAASTGSAYSGAATVRMVTSD